MPRTPATVVIALAALASLALPATPAYAQEADVLVTIRVHVLLPDGDAVEGARVQVHEAGGGAELAAGRTDEDGTIAFDLPPGNYTILAELEGYAGVKETFGFAGGEHDVELALREMPRPDDGEEGEAATVRVVVRDQRGDPVEGALVFANVWSGQSTSEARATTDEDGEAELEVPAGKGHVRVEGAGHHGGWGEFDATDGSATVRVEVFRPPPPDARVEGRVVDEDGEPVEGARVTVNRDWSAAREREILTAEGEARIAPDWCCFETAQAVTDEDGRFAVDVHSGPLLVEVRAPGYVVQPEPVFVDEGETEEVEVRLERVPPKDAVLEGRVTDAATGLPIAHSGISLTVHDWGAYESAVTDADGRFRLTTYPGLAQVWVHVNQGGVCLAERAVAVDEPAPPVETSAEGGADGAEPATDVASSSMPYPCRPMEDRLQKQYYTWTTQMRLRSGENDLDAELEPKPSPSVVLAGWVVDPATEKGVPGASVSLRNEDTGEWGHATTDADGSYRMLVRPGRAVLDVWVDGYFPRSVTFRIGEEAAQRQDVEVTEGRTRWIPYEGECCYDAMPAMKGGGMSGVAYDESASAGADSDGALAASSRTAAPGASSEGAAAASYEGGPGGLGPYRASEKDRVPSGLTGAERQAPAGALVGALAALALVAAVARRR